MVTKTYGSMLDNLNQYVSELREKQAADQGDVDTTHPSKNVDNGTIPATEGARSAENDKDITEDVPGENINDVPAADANGPSGDTVNTTAALSGDDPANETAGTKDTKDDPGTTHPAKTAAEVVDAVVKEDGIEKVASELVNLVREDLTSFETQVKEAHAAGVDAGQAEQIKENLNKYASACAEGLKGYYEGLAEKLAEAGEEPMPGDAQAEGALPVEDLQQLAAVAETPEGMPAESDPMGMGAEEGMVEGMPAEAAAGDASEEEVIQALSEALAEAGVTPEELAVAVEAEQQAVPAGAEGGPSIEEQAAIVDNAKMACAQVNAYRNLDSVGRLNHTKRASIKVKYAMRQLVREATGK